MKDDLVHGGALDHMREAFPEAPLPWLDLSTGINPWPYPIGRISAGAFQHLPGRDTYLACRKAMAGALRVHAESVLPAPGSELLIRLLPTILRPGRIALLAPSYGDHAQVWCAAGADVIETADPLGMAEGVDAVVVCNPNNPDGRVFSPDILELARARLAERGGWLIIDEAYADLSPSPSMAESAGKAGLIVLRSFGKFYGLAGVRLGALLGPAHLLETMSDRLGTWPVSGSALEIGAQAYADHDWQGRTRSRLSEASARLDALLTRAGLAASGGTDLFRFVEAPDATRVWEQLAHAGIYVRRFAWSDRHLRIGLPSDGAAEDRLERALSP